MFVDRRDTIRQVSAPHKASADLGSSAAFDRGPSAAFDRGASAAFDRGQSAAPSRAIDRPAVPRPGNPRSSGSRAVAPGPALPRRASRIANLSPLFPGRSHVHPDPADPTAAEPGADAGPGSAGAERPVAGPHAVELAGLLHELSVRLLSADDVPQALDRLAAFAVRAVPGAQRCSVALIGENAPLTVAGAESDGRTPAEDVQYTLGHGPGLDAARTRALVTSPDLGADERWPELARRTRVLDEGGCAVVAVPLDVDRASVGALCVYVAHPRSIDPDVLLTAMAIVNQAEIMLSEVHRRAHRTAGAAVDRAVGVIIAQRGCGVREAHDVLDDTANRLGLDRHAVAERLIAAAARNADRSAAPS